VVSENKSAAKRLTREQKRKQALDSAITGHTNTSQPKEDTSETAAQKSQNTKEETEPATDETESTEKKDTSDNNSLVRYKVRSKAFFHDSPEESTQRKAFIVHWNNAVLKPLRDRNGFVYVVFTNHEGQTSKGWLSKDDLIVIR
ncbi:MAG TPA: hypothetical protein VFT06_10975, partial [Flavisolibacter sp.]|nr:hypothetical protein [Flavisolibacter sp.]